MKLYEFNGLVYQFEEGKQPAGAVEVKPKVAPVAEKTIEPEKKVRRTFKK